MGRGGKKAELSDAGHLWGKGSVAAPILALLKLISKKHRAGPRCGACTLEWSDLQGIVPALQP